MGNLVYRCFMLYCKNCDIEFPGDQEQKFCNQCGGPVETSFGGPITSASDSDISVGEPGSLDSISGGFGPSSGNTTSGPSNVDIGDKVTNVYNSVSSQDYCAYGGERVYQDKAFRCPECGRDPICTDHFDKNLRLCPFCVESRTTASVSYTHLRAHET